MCTSTPENQDFHFTIGQPAAGSSTATCVRCGRAAELSFLFFSFSFGATSFRKRRRAPSTCRRTPRALTAATNPLTMSVVNKQCHSATVLNDRVGHLLRHHFEPKNRPRIYNSRLSLARTPFNDVISITARRLRSLPIREMDPMMREMFVCRQIRMTEESHSSAEETKWNVPLLF